MLEREEFMPQISSEELIEIPDDSSPEAVVDSISKFEKPAFKAAAERVELTVGVIGDEAKSFLKDVQNLSVEASSDKTAEELRVLEARIKELRDRASWLLKDLEAAEAMIKAKRVPTKE